MNSKVDRAVASGSLRKLVSSLKGASPDAFEEAARDLYRGRTEHPKPTTDAVRTLGIERSATARRLAAHLLVYAYESGPKASLKLLTRLIRDDDRTVHDAATTAAGRLLRKDFSALVGHLGSWRRDPSPAVRRAVLVAAGRAATGMHPEWAEPLLKLVGGLLEDTDPQVRRSLGPACLGGSLLKHYPRDAFEYLMQWSTSNNPQTLWNVAMALSGPPAADIVKKAIIILRKLALDERRYVWRAVSSAIWKLGRKCPDIVETEMARWLEDERRVEPAREAMKHLEPDTR